MRISMRPCYEERKDCLLMSKKWLGAIIFSISPMKWLMEWRGTISRLDHAP